jgi:DinB superfamily
VVMKHDLEQTIALLGRTPSVLSALLRDLPEEWSERDEGENTWSAFDVVGHLVDGERVNWMPRARMILLTGEKEAFVPFDRGGNIRESQGKSLAQMLDEFARLRAANLNEVRTMNLGKEDLKLRGRHPAFGVVTLSELLSTWAVHDMTHLHQISRIIAHQYREAVGPWKEYLGVLQCTGHGSV